MKYPAFLTAGSLLTSAIGANWNLQSPAIYAPSPALLSVQRASPTLSSIGSPEAQPPRALVIARCCEAPEHGP